MARTFPTPQVMTQADAMRYLTRVRFDLARAKGWLKPRTELRRTNKGRALESYSFADVQAAEKKFLGE